MILCVAEASGFSKYLCADDTDFIDNVRKVKRLKLIIRVLSIPMILKYLQFHGLMRVSIDHFSAGGGCLVEGRKIVRGNGDNIEPMVAYIYGIYTKIPYDMIHWIG